MDAILVPTLIFLAMARLGAGEPATAGSPLARALRRARDSGLEIMVILAVATALEVLVAQGELRSAAVLLGAIDADALGPLTRVVLDHADTDFVHQGGRIRASLTPDELARATERGAVMDDQALVAFTLEALMD